MEQKNPDTISWYAHESIVARMERHSKRLFILCIIIFLALVATNTGWIIYESQFEDVVMTQESTTDGGGDAIINGVAEGDINYYGESEANNKGTPQEDGR